MVSFSPTTTMDSDGGGLGKGWLVKARELIPVVLSEAAEVKAFWGKWKVIRNRLEQLTPWLVEIEESPCIPKSGLCQELLVSIVGSLDEARELAKQCTDLSYGGKLKMQSDLDALAAKVDGYLHDCQLIIESGVLRQVAPLALAVSGAKEARKWTVKDLLARLQIGSLESKLKALTDLVDFMNEDDKNVLAFAGQGGVPALVHLLDASVPAMREKAAAAVCILSTFENCGHQMVMEGVLPSLVRLLDSGSSLASEKAAMALQGLTQTVDNTQSVASHGGIPPLIDICRSGTPGAQTAAAGTLRNLSTLPEIVPKAVDEGIVPVLLYLVTSGTAAAQEHAAATIQNISQEDAKIRELIVKKGGIEPLLRFLDGAGSSSAQEIGILALQNLAQSEDIRESLIGAGFLHRLAWLMANAQLSVQQVAALAISDISVTMDSKKAIGELGCISSLVSMLDAKTVLAQEHAARALANLLVADTNRRLFAAEDKGISGLVRLLDNPGKTLSVQFAVSALLTLSGNAKCKKQMILFGAPPLLTKLEEQEVSGTKKLLERLECGKLRSLLRRLDISDW